MPFVPEVVLQKVGNSHMITVAPEIMKSLKWQRGDILLTDVRDGEMVVIKKKEEVRV